MSAKQKEKEVVETSDTANESQETIAADSNVTDTEATENETVTEVAETDASSIFGLIKETANISSVLKEIAFSDLADDFSERQIEKMFNGNGVLASKTQIYSADKAKLEGIIVDKGWGNEIAEVVEIVTELEYVPDGDNQLPEFDMELKESNAEVEIPTDVNQQLFDDFKNNYDCAICFTTKEGELLTQLSEKAKFVAGLNKADTKLWTSIQAKYAKFVSSQLGEFEKPITEAFESLSNLITELDADGQEPIENFRKSSEETAIEKVEVIQGEVELPLTDDEIARKLQLEIEIDEAKALMQTAKEAIEVEVEKGQNASLVMMRNFAEIRESRLYRDTHTTIEEYALDRFGFGKGYFLNMAQRGDFLKVLETSLDADVVGKMSGQTVKKLMDGASKIGKDLGLKPSEFNVLRPIIENSAKILIDASTNAEGEVNITPRIVSQVQQTIADVVKTGTVTIEGQQVPLTEAKKQGLLNLAVHSEIAESVAEGLKANKQYISDEIEKAKDNRFKSHKAVEPIKSNKPQFVGLVPNYISGCDNPNHKAINKAKNNLIVAVFNAGFELACSCKFQQLTTSEGLFVCVETDGEFIQH